MAKTLKELEQEFGAASKLAEKTFNVLNGTGGRGGLEQQYEIAVRNKAKNDKDPGSIRNFSLKEFNALKAKYDKAVLDYKVAQEAKNKANKELKGFKEEADVEKKKATTVKVAETAYDKAIQNLASAEAKFGGYKGQENYIAAYQAAKVAFDEATKAGAKPKALPKEKVAIPEVKVGEKVLTPEQQAAEDQKTAVAFGEIKNQLADPKNKDLLITVQKNLAKNFGYKGKANGVWSIEFQNALTDAAENRVSLPKSLQGADLLRFIAAPGIEFNAKGGTGDGVGGPSTQVDKYPTITNEQDARITINKYFQDNFGRDANDAEFKSAYSDIKKQQAAKPTVRKAVRDAKGNLTYTTTGGTNTEQILNEFVDKRVKLKQEADTYEVSDAKVLQRNKDKNLYETELAKLGENADAIAKLNQSTPYGRSIQSMQNRIARLSLDAGASFSDAELLAIAKEAIDKSLDTDPESFNAFINSKLKFGTNKEGFYVGAAGKNFDALAAVASANGLDLQKSFGTELPNWLASINKGESIDTYKKMIRNVAKIGMPQNIASMLDNGVDLDAIYSPYKNVMASVLEINPESITLNDPTLRSAIAGGKELPIYEFQRELRKDNRWQYTNQAREEVSDSVLGVLRDFGFQG